MAKAAFVDLDGTLILKPTALILVKRAIKQGLIHKRYIHKRYILKILKYLIQNKLGLLDYTSFSARVLQPLKGKTRDYFKSWLNIFKKELLSYTNVKLVKILRKHKSKGLKLVLTTNEPLEIASFFKVLNSENKKLVFDDIICNKLEIKNNKYTGRILDMNGDLWRHDNNKAKIIKEYARKRGINLKKSFAYTDSIRDLSMLKLVGNPIAVNSDISLKLYAKIHGWKII